jgi:hypothetical protein
MVRSEDQFIKMNSRVLIGVFLCVLVFCIPCSSLKISNSPGVYTISNSTVIRHVFYCSLDSADQSPTRDVLVESSEPEILNISPTSFTLHRGFTVPVIVIVEARHEGTIPISFLTPPSQKGTLGLLEIINASSPADLGPIESIPGYAENFEDITNPSSSPYGNEVLNHTLKLFSTTPHSGIPTSSSFLEKIALLGMGVIIIISLACALTVRKSH